jgi:hypothetical protein
MKWIQRRDTSRLAPEPEAAELQRWRAIAWCGALSLIALAVTCSTQLGLTWDEPLQLRYGNRILAWYHSGFRDRSALTYATPMFRYGGLFEAPAQLVAWLLPFDRTATRHVLTSLTAALGVAATWKIAARIAGPRAGFFAASLLVLTPVWIGHGFFNSKDIPFGTAAAWALYATVELVLGPRPVPWRSVAFAGLMTGAALGVRSGGVFLLAYPAIALGTRAWLESRSSPAASSGVTESAADGGRRVRRVLRSVACAAVLLALAWGLMLIAWPWAQLAPFRRPFEAVRDTAHFPWGGAMLFRGEMVNAQDAPADYLPTWFAITLPETYLVAAGCGLALVWQRVRSRVEFADPAARLLAQRKRLALAMIALAVVGPIAAAVVFRPVLYDAQRHFLFVLPPLAALSGCALAAWFSSVQTPVAARVVAAAALVVAGALTTREMIALHPYEYVYFNRFSGGLPSASKRFETDYWGASYHEGLAWVIEHLRPAAGTRLRVASCACFYETRRYIDEVAHATSRFEAVRPNEPADIFLIGARRGCPKVSGEVVHVVERDGVPLLEVVRRDRARKPRDAGALTAVKPLR